MAKRFPWGRLVIRLPESPSSSCLHFERTLAFDASQNPRSVSWESLAGEPSMVCWCNQRQHLGAAASGQEARRPEGSGTETPWWDGWVQRRNHPHTGGVPSRGALVWLWTLRGPHQSEATVRKKVFSLCHMQEHHSGQCQWKVGATWGWGLHPWPMRSRILSAITCCVFPVTVCGHQHHSSSAVETGSCYWDRQPRKWRH